MIKMRTENDSRVCGMSDNHAIFTIHPMGAADTVYNLNHDHKNGYKPFKI